MVKRVAKAAFIAGMTEAAALVETEVNEKCGLALAF
jgi:hypothetical protein